MTRILSQILVFCLMADAAYVAYGLAKRMNMWRCIVLYWVLLTAKNIVDFVGVM